MCFSASGNIVRASVSPVGKPIGWVPHTNKMITFISIGENASYSMIDWMTGDLMWSIDDPIEYTPRYPRRAITGDYLILSGLAVRPCVKEFKKVPTVLKGRIRMLAAIDVNTGRLAAKWYEPLFPGRWEGGLPLPPMPNAEGDLVWYENQLHYVTDVSFSKIDFDDIKNLANGWVGPDDSGRIYQDFVH